MKLLRDESGYVLVLRGLQVLPGGKRPKQNGLFLRRFRQ